MLFDTGVRLLWLCGLCCVLVAIPSTCVFSFCVVFFAAFTFEVSGRDGRRCLPNAKEIPDSRTSSRGVLADAITVDDREEWICKFCSKTNVWTRWRCRRCYSDIPAGRLEKYRQAVSAKNKGWPSGSSSLSGEEGKRPRDQDLEINSCERRWNTSGGSREWRRGREFQVI